MKKYIYPLISIFIVIGFSCHHNPVVPEKPAISFANDVNPIITGNCTQSGCHGQNEHESFSLIGYDNVVKQENVVAGDPQSSKIYQSIKQLGGENMMPLPPNPRLSDEQIETIYLWILQGAKNN